MTTTFTFPQRTVIIAALVCGSATTITACSASPIRTEAKGQSSSNLFAKSTVLWPIGDDGTVSIEVCWTDAKLASVYPVKEFAPNIDAILPERKAWVREIAEAEWEGRTPIRFHGWNDCSAASADAVQLTPIDSSATTTCGDAGGSCAEALGTPMRGKTVFINLFFGEEVRYASLYEQANPGTAYNPNLDMARWARPQACMDEFAAPWSQNNTLTKFPIDINQPDNQAQFDAIYTNCVKYVGLHELGHVIGFAHEQYRTDDSDAAKKCAATEQARGIADDFVNIAPQYQGDLTLGVFDFESIMSYCRLDKSATLTSEDEAAVGAVYDGTNGTNGTGGTGGTNGADGADGQAFP